MVLRTTLNNNVAEQLAGGAEAMQQAVSKFYGREIGTDEMRQLMKDGKLIAKDILPLLADEMAKLARRGDGLRIALQGLAVAQGRMNSSFDTFVNKIYQGGLAEALSSLYKALDKMFYFSDGSGFGKVFLGFFKELENTMWNIWDIGQILGYYFKTTFGSGDGEFLGKMAYWTALFGILGKISGLFKIILGNKNLSGFKGLVAGVGKVGLFASAAALGSTGSDSLVSQGGDMALMVGSMFGPWGLAIGAFVKAGTLVYENWDSITKWWQELDLKAMFLNFIQKIKEALFIDESQSPEMQKHLAEQKARRDAAFKTGSALVNNAAYNLSDYQKMQMAVQAAMNQKDQKVEVQNKVYIDGKEIKTVAEEVVNTSMQRQTQSILPTYLNPASAGMK